MRKWWEAHLDLEQGWIDGRQLGDFGRVISGKPRPSTAVMTVREFDDGEAHIVWQSEDHAAVHAARQRHPLMPSGNPPPDL